MYPMVINILSIDNTQACINYDYTFIAPLKCGVVLHTVQKHLKTENSWFSCFLWASYAPIMTFEKQIFMSSCNFNRMLSNKNNCAQKQALFIENRVQHILAKSGLLFYVPFKNSPQKVFHVFVRGYTNF